MDSGNYSRSDPAVLLLNEIEILLAQARLMELYLKQAQATADDDVARLHEEYERQLALLRAELAAKEEIAIRCESESALNAKLRGQIESLVFELSSERRAVESREADLRNAKLDADDLRDRIHQLETVYQQAKAAVGQAVLARQELEHELDTVRGQLADQQQSLLEFQSVARGTQGDLQDQVAQLQDQLLNQSRSAAHEAANLRLQLGELQLNFDQAQERYAREIETAQTQFHTELNELRVKIEHGEQAHGEMIEVERALKSEIVTLQNQLEQNQTVLQSRNQEARANAERISVLEQELASAHAQLETQDALHQANRDSIAELEYQVAVKERALSERQEAVSAVELALHNRIQTLQQELARYHSEIQERDLEVKSAQAQAETLRERIVELESACAGADARAQERLETVQHELESEITGLRAALALQESAKLSLENALKSSLDELSVEQRQRQEELVQQRQLTDLASSETERLRDALAAVEERCAQASHEVNDLRARIADFEARNGQFEESQRVQEEERRQSELLCRQLEARLEAKNSELIAAQASALEQAGRLENRIDDLRAQLAEKHLWVERRTVEAANLKAELNRVGEQLAKRESIDNETKISYETLAESARSEQQAELASLKGELQNQQRQLENALAQAQQTVELLNQRTCQLEEQHRTTRGQLEEREEELSAAQAAAGNWHERFEQIDASWKREQAARESDGQVRQELETVLASLRSELEQKACALAQRRADLENLALAHEKQIQKLEARIDEQRQDMEGRNFELENARSQAQSLEQRVGELQEAEQMALRQSRQLASQYALKIDDLKRQLAQNEADQQERGAAQSHLEQSLRNHIERLTREAREKNIILQDRNDELVRVKAEMDRVAERVNEIEASASQAEGELASDAIRMRAEFQAQLALLQAELSQKEWALEEQRAAATGITQGHTQQIERLHHQYRQEIETLRKQLADTDSQSVEGNDRTILGEESLTEEQKERWIQYREAMAAVTHSANPSFPASENRRWHSRMSWKRRWKT